MVPARASRIRSFSGRSLERVAFPMGGIGAGMICLDGYGGFSHVSVRHHPQVFNEPWIFGALCVKGARRNTARLLEGPVPSWKVMFPWGEDLAGAGNGSGERLFGLPRFHRATFTSRFPFGTVVLSDDEVPVTVSLTGWSPFVPGDSDSASLLVAGVEYSFVNTSSRSLDLVFSFHCRNFVYEKKGGPSGVASRPDGYVLWQRGTDEKPWLEGAVAVGTDAPGVTVDTRWFRGGWFDTKTMLWKAIEAGVPLSRHLTGDGESAEGGSLYVPFRLKAGEEQTVRVRLCWYVPQSDIRVGYTGDEPTTATTPRYRPWYGARFPNLESLAEYWRDQYDTLRASSGAFTECFFDSTLPPELLEAVAANLAILKSPTSLRQADGRFWGWEGCCDRSGCCHGSCTHVWNYAQALAHLFPDLERSLRRSEFNENQDERGHQNFRARLPIAANDHGFYAAADGQLGGIMKVYRDWRISGDTEWLRTIWPRVRQSLDYCIRTWDPRHRGILEEPHHNTYDIEFWGPDGMCSSFYVGALHAAVLMARALGEDATLYRELYAKGRTYMEKELFNGEYFFQKVTWRGLNAADPVAESKKGIQQYYSSEALEVLQREGPKYQYGTGCLADGVMGEWMAQMCGVGSILEQKKVRAHLKAVFRYNFKQDLTAHVNPQRAAYALNDEAGLVLCTWPRGGEPSLPFPYSAEVWTGIEYQVASHLILLGEEEKGRVIVRAVRARYDGRVRNPFNEFECGHWYARALSSYGLLQAASGVRYDAVERTLYVIRRNLDKMRCFLATASGFGTVCVRKGRVSVDVVRGKIALERIVVNGKVQHV